ncbi:TetR/AcrR family transcriptional regulator [Methylobacillus gramineus]|uniref:TetR/AcrR family transcriptional regulator n=1 Tax=Methylobacillus gramineus TaxID=755169 RepID=UPI001CFF8B8B|nr:TetR/AcrR family transcriptional regulator [Methylobacillus gramineus]MCB5185318.1 TetR/AcrR family transcriptional regulator [Methylobacillus gramineus]
MSPAGRPRTFDREEALKKAMMVFWEKGFEGTTMADLVAAIGMKAPSVYAAFGNKDALFREVVDVYKNKVEQGPLRTLNETPTVFKALENSLRENVDMFSGPQAPSCLIMAGAINCAPEHQEHVNYLMGLRALYKEILKARFDRALAEGELVEGTNTNALAEFYFGFIHGMALRARDGSSKTELFTSTEFALHALRAALKNS